MKAPSWFNKPPKSAEPKAWAIATGNGVVIITPEMRRAGVSAYYEHDRECDPADDIVSNIYAAMAEKVGAVPFDNIPPRPHPSTPFTKG